MPIGFWAINRNDIEELIDCKFEARYGKLPQHSSGYHELVKHITKKLPDMLCELSADFIENEIVSEKSQGKVY